ncbi:MAG: hypothetical protein F2813_04075 [Actinobacteria bacterium]|uniref:Unannotated protein n=1 Tax=freshwater metagenome TaxID=449393 RepID=A0A6J5ZMU8_9ZZZZ|nr:hypothetical protein [Actinomycetota bacterium]
MSGSRSRIQAVAAIVALAALAWLLAGRGLVNYDTLYSLVWGRELSEGQSLVLTTPFAPTLHPFGIVLGILLSPFSKTVAAGVHGVAATDIVLVLAFLALGALIWLTYKLGSFWFGPWAGVLAALIMITRRPLLDFGARAFVDIPYVALVLAAALIESRRRRAAVPVLALLAIAGLIRPEAWAFSGAYVIYLWFSGEHTPRQVAGWLAMAAVGPVVWLLGDWLLAGDVLHSLRGTQQNGRELGRATGLSGIVTVAPRRLGEILREPVLFGALGGLAFSCWALRDRVRAPLLIAAVSLAAFCLLALAGLPIVGRYLLLPAVIGAIFCGAGVFGWRELAGDDKRRRPWAWFAALTILLLIVFAPIQVSRLSNLRYALKRQEQIQGDLRALVQQPPGLISRSCTPISVPNHRPVPLLAIWLDLPAQQIFSAADAPQPSGQFIATASPSVAADYILDPRDKDRSVVQPPASFKSVGSNESWVVYSRCQAPAG